VTLRELAGVLALNSVCVVAGVGIVGARLASLSRLIRLGGLVLLVGFAAVMSASVEVLILVGVRPSILSVTTIALLLGAAGLGVRLRFPPATPPAAPPAAPPAVERASLRVAGAVFFGVVLFFLVDLLRLAYTQGLTAWDAWAFWTPKALAIHHEGLDPSLFETISAHTYPLLVPVTDASVFAFAGGTDPVPLSLQYFVLFAAFIAAVAALAYAAGAQGWAVWPLLATLVVLPAGLVRFLAPQGDFLLDYFLATSVAAALLWLRRRESWLLVCSVTLMIGAATTKREGIAFALATAVALAVTNWRRRAVWVASLALVLLPALAQGPWWLWLRHHGIAAESGPTIVQGGGIAAQLAHRPHLMLPALGATLRATFSTFWWGGAAIVGALAVGAGFLRRETSRISLMIVTLSTLLIAVILWRLLWGGEGEGTHFESPAYPTRRLTGALVLTWLAVGPVVLSMLAAAVAARRPSSIRPSPQLVYGVAVVPAAILLVLALARGNFAQVSEHCRPLTVTRPYGVAFGARSDYVSALAFRRRANALGFEHLTISANACGGVSVVTAGIPTVAVAQSVVAEARSAHIDASIVRGTIG
jgi:hypothetical protein